MALPLILMAAGTVTQLAGQWMGNIAQAEQEKKNAAFLLEQARYARLSQLRAESLAEFNYTQKVGAQIGAYAASGVDSSGSAAITVGGTIHNMLDEMWAIKTKGDLDVKTAMLKGEFAQDRANMLGSFGYNVMQAASTGLKTYAATEGLGKGFPSLLEPAGPPPSGGGLGAPLKYFPAPVDAGRNAYSGYNLGDYTK